MTDRTPSSVIPLNKPEILEEDIELVAETLRRGALTLGPRLLEFEQLVAERTRRPFGVGVASGAVAIEVALRAVGAGPGDEVLVPAFGFSGMAHSVLNVGARPVFVDVDPLSLNMDPAEAARRIGKKTKAMLAALTFGNPAMLPELIALCSRMEIPMVENASEALGTTLGDDNAGRFGRIACIGFWTNRQVTTAEGGMVVTHDDNLAAACRALRNQGRVDRMSFAGQPRDIGAIIEHATLGGYDARMSELAAALGCAQVRRLDATIARRQEVANAYLRRLAANPDIVLPTVPDGAGVSWANFVVRLSTRFTADDRDRIIGVLHRQDIGAANYYPAASLLPQVRTLVGTEPGHFPVAEGAAARVIALPFYNTMTSEDVETVCDVLEVALARTGGAHRP
ncbi:MAG: DegT/DnrJ/EryC1/StrS family aminotransferase [Planctomycetota bacterium]